MGTAIMQKRAPNHLSRERMEKRVEEEPAFPGSDGETPLGKPTVPTFPGLPAASSTSDMELWWEPKCQGVQDAVTPQPGALLRDTALTNTPLTEMHTEHIFSPFPSIFFFNDLVVFQVNLEREKNECKSCFEGHLCHCCISPTREKRNDQLTLCFWHSNLNPS